ncbi:MAG: hypothetical protein FJY65_01965 [Calditrichaeota bacterium]|nr:hypothetical protein [Calditrichota bacterium]
MNTLRAPLSGLVATLALFIASCTLEPPGMPTWTVQGTVPFSERVYRMGELLTDSARMARRGWGIVLNSRDSVLQFESRDTIEYQAIGDRLTYEASPVEQYSNRIDTIHITEPRPDADTINISEANPTLQAGYQGSVAPFVMQQAQDTLVFDVFRWVNVFYGWMRLTVTNEYPFPIDNLIIQLTNLENGDPLGAVRFLQRIMPGVTLTDSLSLAGKYVQNEILMTADATSPGTPNTVTIAGDEKMNLLISISETDVESAEAKVAAQSFNQSDELAYNNRNKIIRAEIKSGRAFFTLRNTTRMRLFSEMRFLNIRDSSGNPLEQNVTLEPLSGSELMVLDLTGATITMTIADQRLLVDNRVTIEDSDSTRYMGTAYQVISGDQGVDVEYWTDELIMRRFEGALDSVRVDIPDFINAIDMPKGLDSVNFTRDTIYLFIENQSAMLMKLNFDILANNSQNGRNYAIPVSSDLLPGLNTIIVPNSDRLLSVVPDTISIYGWAGLGRYYFPQFGYRVGDINENDGVFGNILIRSALKFTIGLTTITTDLTHLKEPLDLDIENVKLDAHLINSIPLAGTVKLLMGNDSLAMDTVANIVIPRRQIVHRRVIAAAETSYTLQIPQSSLRKMRRKPLYTQQIIQLQSSQGDTAWIYPADSLVVQAAATIFYKINAEGGN